MFGEINYLAVLAAAVSSMVVGSVWYAKGVFGSMWMKDVGLTDEDTKKGAGKALSTMFVMSILTAFILAMVVGYMGGEGAVDGLLAGLMVWTGFIFTSMTGNAMFEQRTGPALWIFLGNQLVTLLVMGLILGLWQ